MKGTILPFREPHAFVLNQSFCEERSLVSKLAQLKSAARVVKPRCSLRQRTLTAASLAPS